MPCLGLGSEWQFYEDRSLTRQRLMEPTILFWIDDIDTAGDNCHAAGLEGTQMRGGIDPARQARDDDNSGLTERSSEFAADAPADGRGVAGSDDRHDRPAQQLGPPEHGQKRRRILDRRKSARIQRLAPADHPRPSAVERSQFDLGRGPSHRGHGLRALTAASEPRHHVEGCPRRAEPAQHRVEGDRADCLGAAQPQPVETLLRVEFACSQGLPQLFLSDIRLSVPAIRRRMLAWCRRMINRAIPAITSAVLPSATNGASMAPAAAPTSAASDE